MKQCSIAGCGNKFQKENGIFHGRWYCCKNCADSDPELSVKKGPPAKLEKVEESESEEEEVEIDL